MTFSGRYFQGANIGEILQRMAGFQSGDYDRCPMCEGELTGAEAYFKEFDPEMCSIYIKPCGCRLGLFVGIPEWIRNRTEVHHPNPIADEPTIEELIEDGYLTEDDFTPEHWREYNRLQEEAGQKRLPFEFEGSD